MTTIDRTTDQTTTVDALTLSVTTALRLAGLDGNGVVVERECDTTAVQIDWQPTNNLGDMAGYTARAATARAGRWFLRHLLHLQAPVQGWIVEPETDPYEYVNPVRVTWRAT